MRFRHRLQGLLFCLLVAGGVLAPLAEAEAQDAVYRVSGVFVDASADTATAAREAAIDEAHVEALQRLVRRLVMDQDAAKLPSLSADQIADYVRDFSVSDERTSAGRYLATFSFRFNPAQVRSLFEQYGVRFAETQSKPLVVVPIWGGGADALLWEETNPWLRAWSVQNLGEGLVPLITPLGDLGDVATLNVDQALTGEAGPIGSLAARYRAAGALVAQAVLLGNIEEGNASLAVTTSRLTEGGLNKTGVENFKQEPGEDLASLLERAVLSTAEAAALQWKEANLLNFAIRQTIAVEVPIASLGTWLQIRRRLEAASSVIAVDLRYLRRDQAKLKLTFVGSEEQLVRALQQEDLQLRRKDGSDLDLVRPPQPPGTLSPSYGSVLVPAEPTWELLLLDGQPSSDGIEPAPSDSAAGAAASDDVTVEIQ